MPTESTKTKQNKSPMAMPDDENGDDENDEDYEDDENGDDGRDGRGGGGNQCWRR